MHNTVLISENVLNIFENKFDATTKKCVTVFTMHFLSNVYHYNNQTGLFN